MAASTSRRMVRIVAVKYFTLLGVSKAGGNAKILLYFTAFVVSGFHISLSQDRLDVNVLFFWEHREKCCVGISRCGRSRGGEVEGGAIGKYMCFSIQHFYSMQDDSQIRVTDRDLLHY